MQKEKVMTNRVLIILASIIKNSATGICVVNVAKQLASDGFEVDVLSCGALNTELETQEIHSFAVKPKFTFALTRKAEANHNSKLRALARNLYRLQVAFTSLFAWPWDCSFIFTHQLWKMAEALHKKRNYSFVISVYLPIDSLIVGHQMKIKYPELIYVPYFLDSLSGGGVPRLLSKEQKIEKGLKWERKLLDNADAIVIMKSSEEHHKKYSSLSPYYSKMWVLDIPMFIKPSRQTEEKKKNLVEKTILTYIGTMPLAIRNPYYGLQILKELENVEVRMVGVIPASSEYKKFCEEAGNVILCGPVPHEKVAEFINESDILLNFGNNIAEMVPSKIFEYISYGKPILSFSPNEKDPCIPYLKKYPNACIIDEKNDKAVNTEKVKEFIFSNNREVISFEKLSEMYSLNTPEYFSKMIQSLKRG